MEKTDQIAVIKARLQELLEELQGLQPVPKALTPEALADHEGWMKRHEHIVELGHRAMYVALMALPPDVQALYSTVETQKWHLLNLPTEAT